MARETLDHTGNDGLDRIIGRLNTMFAELYAAAQSAVSAVTGAFSGAVTAASVAVTGALTGATATLTGLVTGSSLKLDTGTKTATASAGAATLSKSAGVITSEALTTAAAAAYTLTLTNTTIAAADQVFASVQNGTNTQGIPVIERVTPGVGSVVIVVRNLHASEALNGTIKVAFAGLKN